MKVAVYCSANNRIDNDFFTLAGAFGHWLASGHYTLVCGGCNVGLMECMAKSVHEAGGQVIGVVPRIVERGGRVSDYLDVNIACDNLSDRKDLMLAQCDVAVALPGGIGTLDEIFGMAASATIGYHHKRVILYNMKGFWQPLVDMLDAMQRQGFIRGDYHDQLRVANSLDEVAKEIEDAK